MPVVDPLSNPLIANPGIAALGARDVLILLDGPGGDLKAFYSAFGLGAPGETGTVAMKRQTFVKTALGDGTSGTPGLTSQGVKGALRFRLMELQNSGRWDAETIQNYAVYWLELDNAVPRLLPSGWRFAGARPLDRYLSRLNGSHPSAPAPPTFTPTLTGGTGGNIPAGKARRVKVSYVGADDGLESLPTIASNAVTLAAGQSLFTVGGFPTTVPSGVTKIRLYSQFDDEDDSADPYYFAHDVPVTAGAAFADYTFALYEAAQELNVGYSPAEWMQCAVLPESAWSYALATAYLSDDGRLLLADASQMHPSNVVGNPMTGFQGFNAPEAACFLKWVNTTVTEIGLVKTNTAAIRQQGVLGATKLQARVASVLNAGATITQVVVKYLNAANPTVEQTATWNMGVALAGAAGSVAEITVTSGYVVTRVTGLTVTGAATGTIVLEPKEARTL